jgi:hypothetical protein
LLKKGKGYRLLNWLSQSFFNREDGDEDSSGIASLTGTTLEVYRFLITHDGPVGPREVMRSLELSGPSVASFHLQKLERMKLIRKDESNGLYSPDHVHLKHFVLLRNHLIPRYFFYAMLSTFSIFGWLAVLPLEGGLSLGFTSQAGAYALIYGISLSIVFSMILWRETLIVMRKERI